MKKILLILLAIVSGALCADAKINVRAVYLATGSRVVMVTDDNAKLRELIANM